MARCSLCHREGVEGGYCGYHRVAHAHLVGAYKVWEKSVEVSWKEFLDDVIEAKETGEWVKDIAQDLLSTEKTGK
jgi:hypothetical protein